LKLVEDQRLFPLKLVIDQGIFPLIHLVRDKGLNEGDKLVLEKIELEFILKKEGDNKALRLRNSVII
jgi:hypothetical protein